MANIVTKHIIEGPLRCPDGTAPYVLSVWKLEPDKPSAWLVTAYPYR